MIIKTIQPVRFGPFYHEAILRLEADTTVLTGANDVGKSMLLEAIRLVLSNAEAEERHINSEHLFRIGGNWRGSPEVGIRITGQVTSQTVESNVRSGLQEGDDIQAFVHLAPGARKQHGTCEVEEVRRAGKILEGRFSLGQIAIALNPTDDSVRDTIPLDEPNSLEATLMEIAWESRFETNSQVRRP